MKEMKEMKEMKDFILSAFADEAADSLDGQLAALKRNRINCIELRNIDGKCVIDLTEEELREIAKKLQENGITVSAIASPIGKSPIDEDFAPTLARFEKAVAAAKLMQTQNIRMFSFFTPRDGADGDTEELFYEVTRRLHLLCEYANKNGVRCCHENEKDIYGDTALRVLSLQEALGFEMDGIFDPANYIQCGEAPAQIFEAISPYIKYLHIKDAAVSDGCIVPAGMGDGGISDILRKFHRKGKGGLLTIEPHLAVFGGFELLQADEIKHRFSYSTTGEAFDVAVSALKELLEREGYTYE